MEKTKIVGNHILTLKRYLSEDKEKIVAEVGLNEKALSLLREFAVMNEEATNSEYSGITYLRYKIKNSLHKNLNDNICFILFHKRLLDTGNLKLSFERLQDANRIIDNNGYLKNVLTNAINLLENHTVTLDINVREGRE